MERGDTVAIAIDVEAQGGHQYVVRLQQGEDVTESWFSVTPEVLEQLSLGDEEDVVRRTAAFLAERQDVVDYPTVVELEDVMATYDDYPAALAG
jgi:hypothetical protein